jgi:hypothetical protein
MSQIVIRTNNYKVPLELRYLGWYRIDDKLFVVVYRTDADLLMIRTLHKQKRIRYADDYTSAIAFADQEQELLIK